MAKSLDEAASKGVGNTALGLSIAALGINALGLGGVGTGIQPLGGLFGRGAAHANHDWELQREVYHGELNAVRGDFAQHIYTDAKVDASNAKIAELEKQIAVLAAVTPLKDALIEARISRVQLEDMYALERRTAKAIFGEVVLPTTPTVTGIPATPSNSGTSTSSTTTA